MKTLLLLLGLVLAAPAFAASAPEIKVGDSEMTALKNGGRRLGVLRKADGKVLLFEAGEVTIRNGTVVGVNWKVEKDAYVPLDGMIPDPNLDRALRYNLRRGGGAITREDLASLKKLEITARTQGGKQVRTLEGLQFATNLVELELSYNVLTNIQPFTNLTRLRKLYFHGGTGKTGVLGEVADFSPLQTLTNLHSLYLGYLDLTDLSPVRDMQQLRELFVVDCSVSSVAALTSLSNNLQKAVLTGNRIANLSGFDELDLVHTLWLDNNNVADLRPLAGMLSLRTLKLDRNQIANLAPLAEVEMLESLQVNGNLVRSIDPLRNLPALASLRIRNNRLSDIAPLAAMPALNFVSLEGNGLDVETNSPALKVIEGLKARGVAVRYLPQSAAAGR